MEIQLIPLQKHGDERGLLIALEEEKNIPFPIKRVYYMFDTLKDIRRGYHAHKSIRQIAIAVRGQCKFHLDDGKLKKQVLLDDPAKGLLIEPYIWHEMYDFSDDCILMVLANDFYDEADYIRNYTEFMEDINEHP
ncbi:sugar 3,4-ketoisomerase [Limnobaculum parvum]|uniref:WxcM-like domain-containing protein n=1 Tax=Limnobaculum parvum TaxID=2172103 RepID=A0A2Y9U1S0_9GAMM|nr:FdtA/QdtA family cupin domain-containing protein [Limnobaculum parvum]AWH89661.1 WxcM-like domain-containing protein [Limnobaculum parvum]